MQNKNYKNGVSQERSEWRDRDLSLRHRIWGKGLFLVDLDFIGVEYAYGSEPVLLVEYKYRAVLNSEFNYNDANLKAVGNLGTAAGIAAILVFYEKNPWWFELMPLNKKATLFFNDHQIMSEREFVVMLHEVRGHKLNDLFLASKLSAYKPGDQR